MKKFHETLIAVATKISKTRTRQQTEKAKLVKYT